MRTTPALLLAVSALVAATVSPLHAQSPLHQFASPNQGILGNFGISVTGVADVDGDSRDDILIGASGESRAYVFSGATGALLHELASPNEEGNGQFGFGVSGVPDVDGDGRGDLLVGVPGEGRAYVYSGASGELLLTLTNDEDDSFGTAVSGTEDVDGDGAGDLIVGATGADPEGSPEDAGRAYVFSGATGTLLHELASPNEEGSGGFGSSVSGVPDVDGDGIIDLIIGASGEGDGGDPNGHPGRAYVFSGTTGTLLHELVSPSVDWSGYFGAAVAGLADVDGDGRGDLLVGAYQEEGDPGPSPDNAGRAYVYSGASGALLYTLVSPDEERDGAFGCSVSSTGDVDGDGVGDLLIGASADGPYDAGRAYVFSGAVSTPTEPTPTAGLLAFSVAPNPAGDRTTVRFTLPTQGRARLTVYDVLGRYVALPLDRELVAGRHEVVLDASDLPRGAYLVRLEAAGSATTQRLTLVR